MIDNNVDQSVTVTDLAEGSTPAGPVKLTLNGTSGDTTQCKYLVKQGKSSWGQLWQLGEKDL